MTYRHWFPKVTSEPPPAPPPITEGSSKGNYKREHFREMPKGPPPALQPKPTLTAAEREAISEVVDCLTETGTSLANPTTTRNTLAALLDRLA